MIWSQPERPLIEQRNTYSSIGHCYFSEARRCTPPRSAGEPKHKYAPYQTSPSDPGLKPCEERIRFVNAGVPLVMRIILAQSGIAYCQPCNPSALTLWYDPKESLTYHRSYRINAKHNEHQTIRHEMLPETEMISITWRA